MIGIRVDRLKVCYKTKEGSIIHAFKNNQEIVVDWKEVGFSLSKVEGTHYDFIYKIMYEDYSDNSFSIFSEQEFGTIAWDLRTTKDEALKKYVWLSIDNRQFYLKYDYRTDNRIVYLDYISQVLGLEFNNITAMDIAVDSNVDLTSKIIRLLRDESYIPIVNGVKISDRSKLIEEILYIGVGNLKRVREYNLLIRQKKAVKKKSAGLILSAYNKKREIENSSRKRYICDAYHNPSRLYRLEVRMNYDALKGLFDGDDVLLGQQLMDKGVLWAVFTSFLNRILRFQTAKGRRVFGVMDLLVLREGISKVPCECDVA